jgi:hypothetical protein
MSRLHGFARAVGIVAVLGWLTAGNAALNAAQVDPPSKYETPAEKIRRALDQTVTLEIAPKDPLGQLLIYLREKAKVPVSIDHAELTRALQAVNRDTLETLEFPQKLERMKLGAVVRSVLRPYHLIGIIADNHLVITSPEAAPKRQLQQTVTLELNDVPLKSALRQLARLTAVNVVIDARVGSDNLNNVTLSIEDVTLETAARLVAEVAGLKAVAVGNVIFVTTDSRAAKLRAEQCPPNSERYPALPALPAVRPLLPPLHAGEKKTPPEP